MFPNEIKSYKDVLKESFKEKTPETISIIDNSNNVHYNENRKLTYSVHEELFEKQHIHKNWILLYGLEKARQTSKEKPNIIISYNSHF